MVQTKSPKSKYDTLLTVAMWGLAIAVIALNFSLIFDNVLWGDEAYSANTVRDTDFAGIIQREYYLDCHPPFYYLYLKVITLLFGNVAWSYHLASVIPFAAGVVFVIFLFAKQYGKISAMFFTIICGLSSTCVEYNLEIRMYSLVFLWILLCIYFAGNILKDSTNIWNWVGITLFGVLAAYTHYYGLVSSGILLFLTGLWYFVRHKGKSWLYGLISIVSYIVLYLPWLFVFIKQALSVKNGWWLNSPASLHDVVTFMVGGEKLRVVMVPFFVLVSLWLLFRETETVVIKTADNKATFIVSFNKPDFVNVSFEMKVAILCFASIVTVLVFVYALGAITGQAILNTRYTYPLIPLLLTIYMCEIKRIFDIVNSSSKKISVIFYIFFSAWMLAVLILGFFDFKYFRSVTKVQDVETAKVLDIVGEPGENTVFASFAVPHLGWTVLKYYYPDNEVFNVMPDQVFESSENPNIDEIWIFADRLLYDSEAEMYTKLGFNIENYEDCWMGKYLTDIVHLYK